MQLNQKFKVELPPSTVQTICRLQKRGGNKRTKVNDFILEAVMERIAYKMQNPSLPTINDEHYKHSSADCTYIPTEPQPLEEVSPYFDRHEPGARSGRLSTTEPNLSNQPMVTMTADNPKTNPIYEEDDTIDPDIRSRCLYPWMSMADFRKYFKCPAKRGMLVRTKAGLYGTIVRVKNYAQHGSTSVHVPQLYINFTETKKTLPVAHSSIEKYDV